MHEHEWNAPEAVRTKQEKAVTGFCQAEIARAETGNLEIPDRRALQSIGERR